MPDRPHVDMRKVRQLVGCDNSVNNRRAFAGEGFADGRLQFVGLPGRKALTAARVGEGREVRVGKFDGFAKAGRPTPSASSRINPKAKLLKMMTLTGSR